MKITGTEKTKKSKMKNYIGLTIKDIDDESINCLGIRFTNGIQIIIEPENAINGIYTPSIYEIIE